MLLLGFEQKTVEKLGSGKIQPTFNTFNTWILFFGMSQKKLR